LIEIQFGTNLAVKCNKKIANHRREVAVLDFHGTEAELQQADTASRGILPASGVLSASVRTAHDDTARCRQRLEDSLTSCTS